MTSPTDQDVIVFEQRFEPEIVLVGRRGDGEIDLSILHFLIQRTR